MLISTLRKAVRAMGGELKLIAAFPDREPVVLCIADSGADRFTRERKRAHVGKTSPHP